MGPVEIRDNSTVVCRIFVCMIEDENIVDFLGRRMIAAYLNVPVYAAFHDWLGNASALAPMWEAWSRATARPRRRRSRAR